MGALVLLGPLHVDLHRVQLEVDLCVIVESTHPTDVPALESMLVVTVVYQSSSRPAWLTTQNTDAGLCMCSLVPHQTLEVVELMFTARQSALQLVPSLMHVGQPYSTACLQRFGWPDGLIVRMLLYTVLV